MAAKDWRGGSSRAGWKREKARPAKKPGDGGWSSLRDRSHERALQRYRLRLFGGLAVATALVIGFVLYLFYIPVRTPLLVVTVTDYDPRIPPNGWALEDAEGFTSLDRKETVKCVPVLWESRDQGLRALRQQLESTKPGGPDKDVVMIYLSMHGVVDGAGEPCLLPPGASPLDSSTWLPVQTLLEGLFPTEHPGALSKETRKVLILDCCRLDEEWGLGILFNSFVERLQHAVEQAAIPNLMVLTSAGPDEVAHAAPELRRSAFAHFLTQGLDGAADGGPSGKDDDVVTMAELHAYLLAQLDQWSIENRFESQRPQLIPADADCRLVHSESRSEPSPPEGDVAADPRWDDISSLWLKHEELAAGPGPGMQPLAWEEFQQGLVRLEQLVLSGDAYQTQYRKLSQRMNALADALAESTLPDDLAAYSIPLARRLRPCVDSETLRPQIEARLHELETPRAEELESQSVAPEPTEVEDNPAARPAEGSTDDTAEEAADSSQSPEEEADTGAAEPAEEPPPAPAGPYPYLAVADVAWQSLLNNPRKERIPILLSLIDESTRELRADVVELHFLRLLETNLDWKTSAADFPLALVARAFAERAAAPEDPRAIFWNRDLVDRADASRRLADDKLFVGSPELLGEARGLWGEAVGDAAQGTGYDAACERAHKVAAAYQLRNRTWSSVPYLARWILSRNREVDDSYGSDLRQLLAEMAVLAEALKEGVDTGHWTETLEQTGATVQEKLDRIEKAYRDHCYQLRASAGEDRRTLRSAAHALSVPLLTGQRRNSLREKYLRILEQGVVGRAGGSQSTSDRSGEGTGTAPQRNPQSLIAQLSPWPVHPALFLIGRSRLGDSDGIAAAASALSLDDETQSPVGADRRSQIDYLSSQGEEIRRLLAATKDDAEARFRESEKLFQARDGRAGRPALVRAGAARADRLLRASASLLGHRLWPRIEEDPTIRLRRLDLETLLRWHCQRSLDDFFGPAPGDEISYFPVVAEHFLESATFLCPDAQPEDISVDPLRQLLATRAQAASTGIRIDVPDLMLIEEDPFLKHEASARTPAEFPPGEAALWLEASPGTLLEVAKQNQQVERRMVLPVANSAAPERYRYLIPNDSRIEATSRCQAIGFYRGHRYPKPFPVIHPEASVEIVYDRPEYPQPTVTVHGSARDPGYSVFVLDGSWSMTRNIGGEETNPRRIDTARDALQGILTRLAASENPHRIGLRFYGHRAGWDPANQEKVFTRSPDLVGLHPSEDVELVLRPGRFTDVELEAVRERLETLRPTGETPLYLSIIQAIKDLRAGPPGAPRHIVVITDGVNEQSGGGPSGVLKYRKDVEDEFDRPGNQNIRLDIIGFDLVAENPTAERKLADLRALAKRTRGAFYPADDPTGLINALEESLELSRFAVLPMPATEPPSRTIDLDATWVVDHPRGRRREYVVRLEGAGQSAQTEIELAGGEAIELYLEDGPQAGKRLVHQRYSKGLRDERNDVPNPADPANGFFVGAHLPEWQGTSVRFPISVQNAVAQEFSPRPYGAWIQIEPIAAGRESGEFPKYVFYDVSFETERPVPVISCTALNWPLDASSARIQIWARLREETAGQAMSVREMVRQSPLQVENRDVTLEVDVQQPNPQGPSVVTLVERHTPSDDIHLWKTSMVPPPDRTIHRFNREVGIVRHRFAYDKNTPSEVRDFQIVITPRQAIQAGAVAVDEPLEVDIPRVSISGVQ